MAIIKQNVRGLHDKVIAEAKKPSASKETVDAAVKIEQQRAIESNSTEINKVIETNKVTDELLKSTPVIAVMNTKESIITPYCYKSCGQI